MKKLYALTALLLGMMGCSEETITYTNPVPGDEPSGIAAELGISSKNTWFAAEDERNASIGFGNLLSENPLAFANLMSFIVPSSFSS